MGKLVESPYYSKLCLVNFLHLSYLLGVVANVPSPFFLICYPNMRSPSLLILMAAVQYQTKWVSGRSPSYREEVIPLQDADFSCK